MTTRLRYALVAFLLLAVMVGGVVAESATTATPATAVTMRASSHRQPRRIDWIARDLFKRLNAERAARGLKPLRWDRSLATYARSWSWALPRVGFQHSNVSNMLAGGRLSYVGENIAWAEGSGAGSGMLHRTWMQSEGHRNNMLSPHFTWVGIGVYCSGGKVFATQSFGRAATLGPGKPAPYAAAGPFVRSSGKGSTC